MLKISHRGNLNGPNKEKENSPNYIVAALQAGFDVEIDVWLIDGQLYLGHDAPEHSIELRFLYHGSFWCHAKNIEALAFLTQNGFHAFWHQEDDVTLTNRGYLWTYPGKLLVGSKAIAVMPERVPEWDLAGAYGICSDYVLGNHVD